MSNPVIERLNSAIEEAASRLASASSPVDIESVRVDFLGRKGLIPLLSKEMKDIPPADRPEAGKAFNSAKNSIQGLLDATIARLSATDGESSACGIDVTLPGRRWKTGRKHPITKVIDECVDIFRRMGFIAAEGPELETVWYNFDALNTDADHPSRELLDTFYFGDGRLLRTHTSSVQIRTMEKQEPPIRIVAPGRCFRRDTPDATHTVNFHHIEGLYIDKSVSLADLKSLLLAFAHEMFGSNIGIRLRPHFFPFTEPSVECDFTCIVCDGKGCRVCKHSGWIEIAGAGVVDPNVLKNVGYDPDIWSGYAFGMGIERLAMIKYRINDIRLLYENDVRFLGQF